MKKRFCIAVLCLFFLCSSWAQKKYWIVFADKEQPVKGVSYVSPDTKQRRNSLGLEELSWSDLPVKKKYTDCLAQHHIAVINYSKWINAVSAILTDKQVQLVESWSFVKEISPVTIGLKTASVTTPRDDNPWKWAFTEIDAASIVKQNLTGKGVKIGIIDGGFKGADRNENLETLVKNGNIAAMRDFVDPTVTSLFDPRRPGVDNHGMFVLQMLGGSKPASNLQYGLATNASFYLARTDDANSETKDEEDYWVRALEWLDSMGVRLVNSSLGYSHYFDNPADNYKTTDMNGRTSRIAKAAQIAIEQKGMIIVSSIGNEGKDSTWQVITTPADAPGVIAVGAATTQYWSKPNYSSIGPSFLSYVKPDIACPSADGTSFSAPFITGLIACMLERNPTLTSKQVKQIIERSGHLYPYANNYIGYGLPDAKRILKLLDNPDHNFNRAEEIKATGDSITLDLDKYRSKPGEVLTFFFKKDKYNVNLQAIADEQTLVLHRKKNTPRITIASRSRVVEVVWQ